VLPKQTPRPEFSFLTDTNSSNTTTKNYEKKKKKKTLILQWTPTSAVADFQKNGIWEWVLGPDTGTVGPHLGQGAPSYVASAANTYRASQLLNCWEDYDKL